MTARHGSSQALAHPRRRFLIGALGLGVSLPAASLARLARAAQPAALPASVAGVAIPDSPIARAAADLARTACPDFLFNHCVRTYLFGALISQARPGGFDAEEAFVASALHDLGLLPRYASAHDPFEFDSAEAARAFLEAQGMAPARIEVVWDAIAMHASVVRRRKALEVRMVGNGAGLDVFGGGVERLPPEAVKAVLSAFPRLDFNHRFEALLLDHCRRKPLAAYATWLEGFCRSHSHGVDFPDLHRGFVESPFKE